MLVGNITQEVWSALRQHQCSLLLSAAAIFITAWPAAGKNSSSPYSFRSILMLLHELGSGPSSAFPVSHGHQAQKVPSLDDQALDGSVISTKKEAF